MKDVKDLCDKYWYILIAVFGTGIIVGICTYHIIYLMVHDSIDQRIKENGRLGYVIEVPHCNIGCKGTPLCCGGSSLHSTIMEVIIMTKKEAIVKLKSEWRAAQTATKMKAVKTLYTEIKALKIADNDKLPSAVEQKVTSV